MLQYVFYLLILRQKHVRRGFKQIITPDLKILPHRDSAPRF